HRQARRRGSRAGVGRQPEVRCGPGRGDGRRRIGGAAGYGSDRQEDGSGEGQAHRHTIPTHRKSGPATPTARPPPATPTARPRAPPHHAHHRPRPRPDTPTRRPPTPTPAAAPIPPAARTAPPPPPRDPTARPPPPRHPTARPPPRDINAPAIHPRAGTRDR